MIVEPLRVEHVRQLRLQAAQAEFAPSLTDQHVHDLIVHGEAYAAVADGMVIACAGVLERWHGRASAWALLSDQAGRHMLELTRAIAAWLERSGLRRVETHVDVNFAAAHRWARLLGFEREGTMRAYTSDGRDADLYARVDRGKG